MYPNLNDIKYFLEVAKTNNISRASERLGITQPTLSVSIKKLEDSLNVKLLNRSKVGITLTKSGIQFLNQAQFLIETWEKIRKETLEEENEIKGRYTIGCHASVALYSLPQVLPNLLNQNKKLEIVLTHDLSRKITEKVISRQIDIGIVVNPIRHAEIVIIELCKDEVLLWESKSNLNPETLICDLNLLQTQSLIKKTKNRYQRILSSQDLEVVLRLTINGCGVGIIPSRVVNKDKNHNLTSIKGHVFLDRICLIYRQDNLRGVAMKHIIKELKKSL